MGNFLPGIKRKEMSNITDSRNSEKSSFGADLPKQAASIWDKVHCSRLSATMLAKGCIKRRRAGDDPFCADCAIGKFHEKYLGASLDKIESAPKQHSLHRERPAYKPETIEIISETSTTKTETITAKTEAATTEQETKGNEMSEFITVREAAKILDYSGWTVTDLCKRGKIKAQKINGVWLIDPASLEGIKHQKTGRKPADKSAVETVKSAAKPMLEKAGAAVSEANKDSMTNTASSKADIRVLSDEQGKVLLSKDFDVFLDVTPGLKNLLAGISTGAIDAAALFQRIGA